MKRRILTFLMMITVAVAGLVTLAPEPAMALGGGNCGTGQLLGFKPWFDGLCNDDNELEKPEGDDELVLFIWTIILNVLFDLTLAIGYIALGLVIYGGYLYIMSQGDPMRVARGKKTLTSAVIGVIIAMLASVLVNTFVFILGINPSEGWAQTETFDSERLLGVFNWAYLMAGIVAVGFIIKSGVEYMLSRGSPDKVRKATQGIIYAAVGLVIVLAAAAITSFIVSSISGSVTTGSVNVIESWLA